MADPATIALAVKAAVAAATDKRTWKAVGVIIAAIATPFILLIVMIASLVSGTADHNNTAVQLSFHGGVISGQVPENYRGYIEDMRAAFTELDAAIAEITPQIDDGSLDSTQVKAIFYSLYFGADSLRGMDYRAFSNCFVRYEERTRTVTDEDGNETEETYIVAVPLESLPEIYRNLESALGRTITYADQANASEIYYRALYGTAAPGEGDGFGMWGDWSPDMLQDLYYNLPIGEMGAEAVRLALSRLGDPYSQELRGQGSYTDCSYLARWVYRQLGVSIPGTAAAQGKYCVDNGLTISKADLAPGDLVFWSHKPNGRYMNITHVGIYAGDGMVVDASSSRGEVVYRSLFDSDKQVLYGRPYAQTTAASSGFISPLGNGWRSMVTSEFGSRTDPVTGGIATHAGIDLGAAKGTPIRAVLGGTVVNVTYASTGYGYHVTVDHGSGIVTLYAHCSEILVSQGQEVSAGDVIARVGSTGKSTGDHLHFEVMVNGTKKNPRNYLP